MTTDQGGYRTEQAKPSGKKANGHAGDPAMDHFNWKTAENCKRPVLNLLWLVKGVIPRNGLGVAYGRPGCGKTFGATDLGLCIAAGIPWRGHKVFQCEVAYISMEAGPACENRVHAWMLHHDRPWPPAFRISPVMINLRSDERDAKRLVDDIQGRGKKVGLVVVDTLARALAGGNENGSEDMGMLVQICEWIAAQLDCFVLLIHHSGKDEARGARGHSSLQGAINTEMEFKRERGKCGAIVVSKQRDGEDGGEFGFDLEQVLLGIDDDGDPVHSCVAVTAGPCDVLKTTTRKKLTDTQQIALNALRRAVGEHGSKAPACNDIPASVATVSESMWRKVFYSMQAGKEPAAKRQAFNRAKQELQAKNVVGIWEEQVWEVKA